MTDLLFDLFDAPAGVRPSEASLEAWHGVNPDASRVLFNTLAGTRQDVGNSSDLERVLRLPRRPQEDLGGERLPDGTVTPPSIRMQALVEYMGNQLRRPDRPKGWKGPCKCASLGRDCVTDLLPVQAWALYEARDLSGLFGLIATGSGKTAIGLLAPMVMSDCELAVGLVPPNLVEQVALEHKVWREHWKMPNLVLPGTKSQGPDDSNKFKAGTPTLHVVKYSVLSQETSTTLLKDFGPKLRLVYADEMHKLSRLEAARTARFLRAFASNPKVRFCGWTGTPCDKEIEEFAHLAACALREGSPVPLNPAEVRVWGAAINPSNNPAGAGALMAMCEPGETLHSGFRRRLVQTPGVVVTQEGAVSIPLYLHEREAPPIPAELQKMLNKLRTDWERPDGEQLVDILEEARTARELACGFYYRWIFPKAERKPDGTVTDKARWEIERWFARRKAWRKELRLKLIPREEHLDSEKLCTDAAERFYNDYEGDLPTWDAETYLDWMEVKDAVYHETEAVWVDDYLALDAAAWAKEHRGLVWYEHTALGERIAELSGLPLHGGGPGAETRILAEKGDRSLVVSVDSHGTGRDGLQRLFNKQILTTPLSSGKGWEQLLARLHRVGQKASRVDTWVYRHVPEMADAIDRAKLRGEFVNGIWGSSQKLLNCQCSFL